MAFRVARFKLTAPARKSVRRGGEPQQQQRGDDGTTVPGNSISRATYKFVISSLDCAHAVRTEGADLVTANIEKQRCRIPSATL